MVKKTVRFAAAMAVFAAIALLSGIVGGNEAPHPHLPPCVTEDSDNCYWDAATRSNGTGNSFTVIDGVVAYK